MIEVMMALGTYRFSLSTAAYERLRRSASWRWPSQDRLGAHPVRQYVGPGKQRISLDGKILPHYKGLLGLPNLLARVPALAGALGTVASAQSVLTRAGLSIPGADAMPGTWEMEQMRSDANLGLPLSLVDGRGRVWGYWCIVSMDETEGRHMADGAALSVRFRVQLDYYGDAAPESIGTGTTATAVVRGILGV